MKRVIKRFFSNSLLLHQRLIAAGRANTSAHPTNRTQGWTAGSSVMGARSKDDIQALNFLKMTSDVYVHCAASFQHLFSHDLEIEAHF